MRFIILLLKLPQKSTIHFSGFFQDMFTETPSSAGSIAWFLAVPVLVTQPRCRSHVRLEEGPSF